MNSYLTYARRKTQTSYYKKLYWFHLFDILIAPKFVVNNPSDKRQENVSHLRYLIWLMQRYYKLSKIEKNGNDGIVFFFLQIFFVNLPAVNNGKKYHKALINYRGSSFTESTLLTGKYLF